MALDAIRHLNAASRTITVTHNGRFSAVRHVWSVRRPSRRIRLALQCVRSVPGTICVVCMPARASKTYARARLAVRNSTLHNCWQHSAAFR